MRFSRARYVTLCQQSLVTAAVLAVGVSAAGVKTLDIVPQPGQAADLGSGLAGPQPREALADRIASRREGQGRRGAGDPEGSRGQGDRHLRQVAEGRTHNPADRAAGTEAGPGPGDARTHRRAPSEW